MIPELADRLPRTLLEQRIRQRRMTFEEFTDHAVAFARDHHESGTPEPAPPATNRQLGLVVHRDGLVELAVYAEDDPDIVSESVMLQPQERVGLAEPLSLPRG